MRHRRGRGTCLRASTGPHVVPTLLASRGAAETMAAMRGSQVRPLPIVLFGLTLAAELAAIVLSWGLESRYDTLLYAVYSVSLAGAGALIASRQSHNPIGWLFCSFARPRLGPHLPPLPRRAPAEPPVADRDLGRCGRDGFGRFGLVAQRGCGS
jgi:hypothetical protein